MVNLWDVPDMNVGDMVNGYTYVFYTIMFLIGHMLPNAVIPYKTHYVYPYLSVNIRLDIRYKDVYKVYISPNVM